MSATNTDDVSRERSYVTTYDAEENYPLSTAVVFAIAEAKERDPTELRTDATPPLADVLDPESLDTLPESATDAWTLEVEIWNCLVTVKGEGTISVRCE